MVATPIVERELRLALRRHASCKSRFRTAAMAAALAAAFLLLSYFFGSPSWGSTLHEWFFYGGLYLAVVPSLQISTALFSAERRNQTMELLFLAGMRSSELFAGKLLGGLLVASGDLMALFPFMAVPFLSGGISFDLYAATVASLPMLLLFTVSTGVLASVLCKDEGSALMCALVLAGAACLAVPLPYYLGSALAGAPPFSIRWLCLSPAFGPYLVVRHFHPGPAGDFWLNAFVTLLLSGLNLGLAAMLLRRNWRNEVEGEKTGRWQRIWWQWVHGSAGWRETLRQRLLPESPYQWLVQQDRHPVVVAWVILAGAGLAWLAGSVMWPRIWLSTTIVFSMAVLLMVAFEFVMTYAAGRRIGTDRRDGLLELELTTSLTPREIVDGQTAGLKAQFRTVRFALFGLCVFMMAGAIWMRNWNPRALISYFLIWSFMLYWCVRNPDRIVPPAMWKAVNSGRPMFAVFHNQQGGWWWFYMLWNFRSVFRVFSGGVITFPTGSVTELVIVCTAWFFAFLGLAIAEMNSSGKAPILVAEMRLVAQEPVPEANDPRFKKWDGQRRMRRSV